MVKLIETLAQFYDLMWETVHVRRQAVACLVNEEKVQEKRVTSLQRTYEVLESLPKENGKYKLKLKEGKYIDTELTYEIDELKKDLVYLKDSEETFYDYLERYTPGFFSEVEEGVRFIDSKTYIKDGQKIR